jgi:hydrogenase assembly chaperone HypC/HupF
MCLTAPARIERVDDDRATVRVGQRTLSVSAATVPDALPGDWVLVAGGVIVRRIDPERAAEIAAAFDTLKGDPQ